MNTHSPWRSILVPFIVCSVSALNAPGQTVVLSEDFNNLDNWDDLSLAVNWGDPRRQHTAFHTVDGAVGLIRSGPSDTRNYLDFSTESQLRTFAAIDRRFSRPVDHATEITTVSFRARWGGLELISRDGERGRLVVVLNHDYPEGGLPIVSESSPDSKVIDNTAAWWARPSYHMRIRSGGTSNTVATSFLMWGGGHDNEGEYEYFAPDNDPRRWWLPGFVAGSFRPGGDQTPGRGSPWPVESWTATSHGLASTTWARYSLIIRPDRFELWADFQDNGTPTRYASMSRPLIAPSHPNYRYFEQSEGIRFYWQGMDRSNVEGDQGQVWIDEVTVTATRVPSSEQLRLEFDIQSQVLTLGFFAEQGVAFQAQYSRDMKTWTNWGEAFLGDDSYTEVTGQGPDWATVFVRLLTDRP